MSLEAEQGIIAGMITSDAVYDSAVDQLKAVDFANERMSMLFELVTKLKDMGRATDTITLAAACASSKRWALTGMDDPLVFIDELSELSRTFHAAPDYIRMVKAASIGRMLVNYCGEVYALTQGSDLTGEEMLAQAHQLLPTIENAGGAVAYRDAAKEAIEAIQRRMAGELLGVTTGLPSLDKLILGWEPGTLVILAGRPSHGKSIYAMDFAHAAAASGPVFIFSLEMTTANLATRGIASLGGVDFGDMRAGKIDGHMEANMAYALSQIKSLPILIDDRGGLTVDQLSARARAMARREKPSLIVVDYLQLLAGKGDNRTAQIGNVSRSLKALAKELSVPVLCLSQLSRAVDSRTDKRPLLSDLRESGEIEQDADVVLFTYLHEKYDPDTPRKNIGELVCRKQRNGETGSIFTEFQGRYSRFREFNGVVPPMTEQEEQPRRKGRGMSSFLRSNAAVNDAEGF
jgi:replicative DNA helicase